MPTPLLLAATTTTWFGTARVPRALVEAGFEVTLLTPRNSLAEKSGYLRRIAYLRDDATERDFVAALGATVAATAPRLVVPCDDMAFRLLARLVLNSPPGVSVAQRRLADLVRESLGDPAHYLTSVDKTLLPPAAQALGLRVLPFAIVSAPEEAESFIAEHGFPLVLKNAHGFAGEGVAFCSDRDEFAKSFAQLSRPTVFAPIEPKPRLLLQRYIEGSAQYFPLAAWRGELVAGWAVERVVGHPAAKGPATVVRHLRSAEVRAFAERIVRGFGMSGLLNLECMIEQGTGRAYLLELSRRVNPGIHRGRWVGVDVCAALHAAATGMPWPSGMDVEAGEGRIAAHFPQEWLRDPGSSYLRDYPVDVPWDEPELLEAMLAMRHH